jgi:site-specific recombinase XerD
LSEIVQFADAVNMFLDGYFSTCRRSGKTRAAYRIDLAQLQQHVRPETTLQSVDAESLERWAKVLQLGGYASVSIRRKFATARVFFLYWVRKGTLDKSPLWRIRLDLVRERLLPRSLAPSDAKRVIEEVWHRLPRVRVGTASAANPYFVRLRNTAALEILFATGIRVGELVSLSLVDWRPEEHAFVIQGKGSRQRLVFLPDERSRQAVQSYLQQRQALSADGDALLLNVAGDRLSTQGVARIIALTAKSAGLTIRVTPHMIRHTVATLLLRYGADIRIVQEVLGHASIATTQRYTHVAKDHLVATLQTRHPNHHLDIQWHRSTPVRKANHHR